MSIKGWMIQKSVNIGWDIYCRSFNRYSSGLIVILAFCFLFSVSAIAQTAYEGKKINELTIVSGSATQDPAINEQMKKLAQEAVGTVYSSVNIRDAIERLYNTKLISSVTVEASDIKEDQVDLRFVLVRKVRAQKVTIEIAGTGALAITEQELLFRLNLLEPGTAINEQAILRNADRILDYLRERGYFKAEITHEQRRVENSNDVVIVFKVTPHEPAKVGEFNINIEGIDRSTFAEKLDLQPGKVFTRELLTRDIERIRNILRQENFLAPFLEDARPVYDSDENLINISLNGNKGPVVEVTVEAERDKASESVQRRLLPVKREGSLDLSAIIEGERRLETHYQELGYFFADVKTYCSVNPPLIDGDLASIRNDTEAMCSSLNSADLTDRKVLIRYDVNLSRQLKLADIRLEGTDQFTIDEIKTVLESQEANFLGIIPLFGYGRGYTSEKLLEEDTATIRSLLRELGYRNASVRLNQGVSPDGENLVITFVVEQGPPTVISDVTIKGNQQFSDEILKDQLPPLIGKNFSRAKIRNGQRKLAEFYANAGYFDTIVDFSIDERTVDETTGEQLFSIVYEIRHKKDQLTGELIQPTGADSTLEGEGRKVFVGNVSITGNNKTRSSAIERALHFRSGEVLRSTDIYQSEQNLYSSDVFSKVEVKQQPAGENSEGRVADLIVGVEEQAPRILSYGGGYSTDVGASGFVDIRHLNLLGRLWQGGARVRLSQRQQIAQIDYVNPRFMKDGKNRFAPLTLSAQYQRDSTVTRFFRSAFDKGTFGIVQRLDEEGNPVDEFGANTGSPTLNRLTLTAETNRTIQKSKRSILFLRYRFEDVRLYNIESLLIKELLIPDSRIRISGFGFTLVRDTRENCSIKYTILEIIDRGEPGEPCRYNAGDPTKGSYLTAELNTSIPALGANIGFNKFQASYNFYYTPKLFGKTTFAARVLLGLANVYSSGDRFQNANISDLDGILPISERFFAGGANTLRGFDFESAGPRVVIVPSGTFHNSSGEVVVLDPFTIPFGGNALAVVNLEARVPVTDSIRFVPFYDGGNVFRKIGDIFNPPNVSSSDVFRQNLRALWSHTVGLGIRLKTPIGGEIGVDYGYLLNPPQFLIPQSSGPNAIYRLPQGKLHFRFSQSF